MSEARDTFAARMNRRNYGSEMTDAESVEAKAARLLVVFGASDDLTEFRGIIHDEAGAYDGAQHGIVRSDGRWIVVEGDSASRKPKRTKGALVEAEWCPPELPEASWLIKPSVPHATFDILEDGELYCRGAVIDEFDLLPPQRVIEVAAAAGVASDTKTLAAIFSQDLTMDDIASIREHLKGWSR